MARAKKTDLHDFFCVKCGNKGIPVMRKRSHNHGKFHRKKLYCLHCKQETNHIECKNEFEAAQFLIDYQNGVYEDEAKEYISDVGSAGIGEINLGFK